MFERKAYEILKKAEIEISAITMEYLLSLSNEDLKILNDLILYYGDDDIFNTVGKAKLQVETKNIRSLAEHWLTKKVLNPKAKPPNIHEVLKDEINKLHINSNESSELIITKKIGDNLPVINQQAITKIEITNLNDIEIHDNYQLDLFALQFPIFALKLDRKKLTHRFTNRQGVEITLRCNDLGRATIQDADLWLYCITKMMQMIFEQNTPTRRIIFTGADFLKSTGRKGGANYQQIIRSLERLEGTSLTTNQTIGIFRVGSGHGLIDSYGYIEDTQNKKIGFEVVLPEWLFTEVIEKKIARINPDYLKLKPFDKRIYQLARCSHFYDQKSKKIINITYNLEYFAKKLGSNTELRFFKREIKKLTLSQPLPEYLIHYDNDKDQVYFTSRQMQSIENQQKIQLKLDAKAKRELIENSQLMFASNITKKKELENIQRVLEINFFEKNYPIFQTEILSEKKLKEYLKKFDAKYLMSKIIEFIDFDFTQKENPEGYFYGILENKKIKNKLKSID